MTKIRKKLCVVRVFGLRLNYALSYAAFEKAFDNLKSKDKSGEVNGIRNKTKPPKKLMLGNQRCLPRVRGCNSL